MTAPPEVVRSRSIGRTIFLTVFLALLVLTIVMVALSFPAGIYAVFSGGLSTQFSINSVVRPYLWIGPVAQFVQVGINAGAWFLALLAVYAFFLLYAARQTMRPFGAVVESFRSGVQELFSSPFIVTIVAIGFLIFTTSEIDRFVSPFLPIGNISGDAFGVFVGLTYPPLVEEFGFRVLLVGTVAFILSMGRPLKTALAAVWRPSKVFEGLAAGSGASIIIWVAMGLSALTFGACHVYCGSNSWQIGKLPEAVYGGVVLGYVYVKYGFHVAVLTHWGVDYFGSAFSFFGQAAYGIPWDSATKEFIGQLIVDYDMLYYFGLACFLLVLYIGVKKLAARKKGVDGQFNEPLIAGPSQ